MGSNLAQQEIFEAPPRDRIIVPAGATAWWGVDPSSKRVSIGVATEHEQRVHRAVRTVAFSTDAFPRRLSHIYALTRSLAIELAAKYPPGLILVEQPSGKFVEHELEYAVGVIQAAVYDGAYQATGNAPRIDTVASSWWKLRACGRGNIHKTQKVDGKTRKQPVPLEEYGVMKWARLVGYQGASWDEADALAIAEAGRREHALEPR